ncbi:LysM peptidoglycan-binding domain-containing protein [Micromonospora sp. WMMD1102]|uniref:LysM peptidoglycan-binding domain-containing protein n=1 Tax=Micromonospora sp. WMMD1102 TaxID=3016105 RepID=UPI0024157145|nr:LysM peptidoglycan-binding domain-containing protein [Micromonospora sp. WMMD1102]MDG4785793.1 LysM peptidoglycan-binding domain-containing protein [Micromonospora sp. WMMD1102]
MTVLLLLLVAGLAAVLSPASRAADPARPAETAVVLPGDTLWSVAERHRPGQRPFAVIDEIRRLNGLEDHTVHAGQRLILPAER